MVIIVRSPVTRGDGTLTREGNDWLPFASATISTWLAGMAATTRAPIAVLEMGPVRGGYNFDHLPNSWEDAVRLRLLVQNLWQQLIG
jgi:hypothetical protein